MGGTREIESLTDADAKKCLARAVAQALAENPLLEAVTVDRARQTISVATLGRADIPELTRRISATIQLAQDADAERRCTLLTGQTDCGTCTVPLGEVERRGIKISQEAGATTIARVTCPTAPKFWRWRDIPWPRIVPRELELHEHAEEYDEWKSQLVAALLCGVFGMVSHFFLPAPYATWGFVLAYLAGGWYTVQEVWERLQERVVDVHFLMVAVALGSASIGAWSEGAILLFLFPCREHWNILRWAERSVKSVPCSAPLRRLQRSLTSRGNERETEVERLVAGMRLLIKPGAQFPVDAEIAKGQTASDESNLTGEATPVEKSLGDTVLAGTINLWGAVEVTILRPAEESSLRKIIRLIKEAQRYKAPAQQFTDKFGTFYTYGVLALSLVMFFVWWLVSGEAPFVGSHAGKQRLLSRDDSAGGRFALCPRCSPSLRRSWRRSRGAPVMESFFAEAPRLRNWRRLRRSRSTRPGP